MTAEVELALVALGVVVSLACVGAESRRNNKRENKLKELLILQSHVNRESLEAIKELRLEVRTLKALSDYRIH